MTKPTKSAEQIMSPRPGDHSEVSDSQAAVSFSASNADCALVGKIVDRAVLLARKHQQKMNRLSTRMDLLACHANGNPMDFAKLLAADDFNFAHDVLGIERHLDRETGKLQNFFSPRCSAKATGAK